MKNSQGIKQFVQEKIEEWKVPGAAIAVVKDDEVIFSEGFDYRDTEKQLEVTSETIFPIGSATKAFATAAMGVLVDEGKLDWDQPVKDYLPEFQLQDPVATERATPRDLASHRTGLPRHELMWYNADYSREELLEKVRHLEPNQDFRSKWQYQNVMYVIAGLLTGKIAGTTWEEYVRQRLLTPLHMHASNFSINDVKKQANYALPYREEDRNVGEIPFRPIDAMGPAGSINSNVDDMTNWLLFQLNQGTYQGESIINASTIKTMHTPHMPCGLLPPSEAMPVCNYGLGWMIEPYRGHHMIHHGGSIDGFTSLVSFMPYDNIGVVVLTNKDNTLLPQVLTYHIYDHLLGLKKMDWNEHFFHETQQQKDMIANMNEGMTSGQLEDTSPSHPLDDYTGNYAHPGYGDLTVEIKEEQLEVLYHNFNLPLQHYHYDIFIMDFKPLGLQMTVSFSTNVQGQIASCSIPLAIEPNASAIEFTKKPDESLMDAALLASFEGQYDLSGAQTITVHVKNEQTLYLSIPGQPDYELEPSSDRNFQLKNMQGFQVRFGDEQVGKANNITLMQPNGEFTAERIK